MSRARRSVRTPIKPFYFFILVASSVLSLPTLAYVQIEVSANHWARIIDDGKRVHYWDCGSKELTLAQMEALSPVEIVSGCNAKSHYAVDRNPYRFWTAALYGVPTRSSKQISPLPNELGRRIEENRSQRTSPPQISTQELNRWLHLEETLFRYLGEIESVTLRQREFPSQVYAAISGFVPTFSNGEMALKLFPLKLTQDLEGCPQDWAPASVTSLAEGLRQPQDQESFLGWLKSAANQQGLKQPPVSLLTWHKWVELKNTTDGLPACLRKDFIVELNPDGALLSHWHHYPASKVTLNIQPEAIPGFGTLFKTISTDKDKVAYGLCVRRELPQSPLLSYQISRLRELGAPLNMSNAELYRLLMTDTRMEHLVARLLRNAEVVAETGKPTPIEEVQGWIKNTLFTNYSDYFELESGSRDRLDISAKAIVESVSQLDNWVKVCNYTSKPLDVAIAVYLDEPRGWTSVAWAVTPSQYCTRVNVGTRDTSYIFWKSENNLSIKSSLGLKADAEFLVGEGKQVTLTHASDRAADKSKGTYRLAFTRLDWKGQSSSRESPRTFDVYENPVVVAQKSEPSWSQSPYQTNGGSPSYSPGSGGSNWYGQSPSARYTGSETNSYYPLRTGNWYTGANFGR